MPCASNIYFSTLTILFYPQTPSASSQIKYLPHLNSVPVYVLAMGYTQTVKHDQKILLQTLTPYSKPDILYLLLYHSLTYWYNPVQILCLLHSTKAKFKRQCSASTPKCREQKTVPLKNYFLIWGKGFHSRFVFVASAFTVFDER